MTYLNFAAILTSMSSADSGFEDLAKAPAQRQLLIAILQASPEGSRSPTVRELNIAVHGRSIGRIAEKIRELKKKGYVEGDRQIRLTARALDWLQRTGEDTDRYARPYIPNGDVYLAPLLGEIAAGNPIAPDSLIPEGDVAERIPLPARDLPPGQIYLLRVAGDSMLGDCILDGDLAIVVRDPGSLPGRGEILAAFLEGGMTVKHYVRRDGRVWLEGSNPAAWRPRLVEEIDDFQVQGRVIGILRITRSGL